MIKLVVMVFFTLFSVLAQADGSLNFSPPSTDYSMVFLGNMFGVVGGILHGTGSQIMGAMFAVFNAAVLAVGGTIMMYTLTVATMNTAHEGQMLGQKWSSMWIPIRSTVGLALLIPKASGYCMMQVIVMWIVVQGVGAADKVWEAALGYMNRGGVILQSQVDPSRNLIPGGANSAVPTAAMKMLLGQVCMLGLQKQLESQRDFYIDAKRNKAGPCYQDPNSIMVPDSQMMGFCNTVVPDFLSTFNAVTKQSTTPIPSPPDPSLVYKMEMPSFTDTSSPYYPLHGICGYITWNPIAQFNTPDSPSAPTIGQNYNYGGASLTYSEYQTTILSRAIAIQQMYTDLLAVSQVMVNNDPQLNNLLGQSNGKPFSTVATQQFGVPYQASGAICQKQSDSCSSWGPADSVNGVVGQIFNGTEFLGAVTDYNAVMAPTLNLMQQAQDSADAASSREFIIKASEQGWIMAGSYFFDLVKLNGSSVSSGISDSNTGLEGSQFKISVLSSPCTDYGFLCKWFRNDKSKLAKVKSLIDGSNVTISNPQGTNSSADGNGTPALSEPKIAGTTSRTTISGVQSSTVFGYINNSLEIKLSGQPGMNPISFPPLNFSFTMPQQVIPNQSFACGSISFFIASPCFGRLVADFFVNKIFIMIMNLVLQAISLVINSLFYAFISLPIMGLGLIFKAGIAVADQPGVNPIIALANMGAMYINFAGNLWLYMLQITIATNIAFSPLGEGSFVFALITLTMPLFMAWLGIMVSIGFLTAYYIPLLPYIIFTLGSLAWLIAVVEAMVSAPIVALGVSHPEGHDAFGKGEAAIMILMNVFLRPSMMIIGYISGIALSYVGVWMLNAGFSHAISSPHFTLPPTPEGLEFESMISYDWATNFTLIFSIIIYTSVYLTIVQKAFTLIAVLPDKVMRWIGGSPESYGSESAQWADESKQKVGEAATKTHEAQGQMSKAMGGMAQKGMGKLADKISPKGGTASAEGSNESTPSPPTT